MDRRQHTYLTYLGIPQQLGSAGFWLILIFYVYYAIMNTLESGSGGIPINTAYFIV